MQLRCRPGPAPVGCCAGHGRWEPHRRGEDCRTTLQNLCDCILHFNERGLAGPSTRRSPGRALILNKEQRARPARRRLTFRRSGAHTPGCSHRPQRRSGSCAPKQRHRIRSRGSSAGWDLAGSPSAPLFPRPACDHHDGAPAAVPRDRAAGTSCGSLPIPPGAAASVAAGSRTGGAG